MLDPVDCTTGRTILDFAPNFCWDPVNHYLLLYNSGSHGESMRRVLRFRENQGADGSWDEWYVDSEGWHTYSDVDVVAATGHLWFWDICRDFVAHDFTGSGWTTHATTASFTTSNYPACAYHNLNGKFYGCDDSKIESLNMSTYATTTIATGSYGSYHHYAVYCPVVGYMWFGGSGTNVSWRMSAAEAVSANAAASGIADFDLPDISVTACPINGDLLVLAADGSFRKLVLPTNTWTTGLTNTYGLVGGTGSTPQLAWGPVSTHGVIYVLEVDNDGATRRAYLYKHSAGAPTGTPVLSVR